MLLCIFVKKQGSNKFSSNGKVKIFSSESRKFFVKKQPHLHIFISQPSKNPFRTFLRRRLFFCFQQELRLCLCFSFSLSMSVRDSGRERSKRGSEANTHRERNS